MKKGKQKYTPPNYDHRKATFILRLEKSILKDGFESLEEFVRFHIYDGKNLQDIRRLIAKKYKLKVTILTIRNNLRQYAPRIYCSKNRGHIKRIKVARHRGSFGSVTNLIKNLTKVGYNNNDFSRIFKISTKRIHSQFKMYPINIEEILPDMVLFGMKRQKIYIRWLKIANKFNFDSVPECIVYLIKEKGLSLREVGFIFGVARQSIQAKIKRCEYLHKELNY